MDAKGATTRVPKILSEAELSKLSHQDSRGLVSHFHQSKIEKEAAKNWDKFYNRNGDRFFKDRHWTTREFVELLASPNEKPTLLEVGCGVGNFFYPLLEDGLSFKVHAFDFSPRAIEMVKMNHLYDSSFINAFVCDITKDSLPVEEGSVDIVSLIFVLSALLPSHIPSVLGKLVQVLHPGGLLLLRDYGIYDMAMIRFNPGNKLGERLYVRQDGTRAFYFTVEELEQYFVQSGLEVLKSEYVSRRTVNHKEGVDAERVFVQVKCRKPSLVKRCLDPSDVDVCISP